MRMARVATPCVVVLAILASAHAAVIFSRSGQAGPGSGVRGGSIDSLGVGHLWKDGSRYNMIGMAYPAIDAGFRRQYELAGSFDPPKTAPFYYELRDQTDFKKDISILKSMGATTIQVHATDWQDYITSATDPRIVAFTAFLNEAAAQNLDVIPMFWYNEYEDLTVTATRNALRTAFSNFYGFFSGNSAVLMWGLNTFHRTTWNMTGSSETRAHVSLLLSMCAVTTGSAKPCVASFANNENLYFQINYPTNTLVDVYRSVVNIPGQPLHRKYDLTLNGLIPVISHQRPRIVTWGPPKPIMTAPLSGGTPYSICGDGVTTGAEQCDDYNMVNGDGCDHTCQVEQHYYCTTQTVTNVGQHYDSNDPASVCTAWPKACTGCCGNGILEALSGEQCDDGNTYDNDGCTNNCQVEGGFTCNAASPTVCY